METGKVEFAPDYKSEQPRPPKDFGRLDIVCADGEHRFLAGAPICGCGAQKNPTVEHQRLQSAALRSALRFRKADLAMDNYWDARSRSTDVSEETHMAIYPLAEELSAARDGYHEAVDALISFEAEHKIGESNEHVD